MERPSWDEYFMQIAEVVSTRSIDPNTKHGSVIVDKNNRIISTGYNSPPKGMDDKNLDLSRPAKYLIMNHSESNAIIFAKQDLEGCKLYVTGMPCNNCARLIAQSGIKHIVYGDRQAKMIDEDQVCANKMIFDQLNIKLEKFNGSTKQKYGDFGW